MITKVKSDYIITLADAKAHLRVDTIDEDSYISNLIKAAVEFAEQYIQKDIAVTANTLVIEEFSGSFVEVDLANLVSVTSVKNGLTSLPYSELIRRDAWFHFELDTSVSEIDLTIECVTGYTLSTLPFSIRQAILIKIADLYDNERNSRTFSGTIANTAFESLLNYFMSIRVKRIRN